MKQRVPAFGSKMQGLNNGNLDGAHQDLRLAAEHMLSELSTLQLAVAVSCEAHAHRETNTRKTAAFELACQV